MISRRRIPRVLIAAAAACCALAWALQSRAQGTDLQVYRTAPVTAIMPMGDGRALVAGGFDAVNGDATAGQVVRLDAAGAIDPEFRIAVAGIVDPNAAGVVRAMAIDPASGEVILAGAFSRVQGEAVAGLAKVDASGVLTPWRTVPGDGEPALIFVDALLRIAPDTLVAVAALEDRAGPQLLRIDAASGVYETLYSIAGNVTAVLAEPDGGVLLGGNFLVIDGTYVGNIARLAPGTLALERRFLFRSDNGVTALARSPRDGLLYVGADARVTRLQESGGPDPKYFVAANAAIERLLFDDSGRLYVAGAFSIVNAAPRARLARVLADGALDPAWQPPEMRGSASRLGLVGSRLLAGGTVLSTATDEAGLMTLSTGPTAPSPSVPALRFGRAVPAEVRVLGVRALPDGGAMVAGFFSHTRDAVTGPLLRLDAAGSPRPDWSPLLEMSAFGDVAVSDDGSVYLSARLALGSGLADASQVVHVPPEGGAVDPIWRLVTSADGPPTALALRGNQIYVGGQFLALNGVPQARLARANRSGTAVIDPAWTPVCNSVACAAGQIIVRADGSVVTLPVPWSPGGVDFVPPPPPGPPVRLLSLVTTTTAGDEVVSEFGPLIDSALSLVTRLAIDSQQRLYLSGTFRTAGPPVLASLARALPDGSIDATFAPDLGDQRVAAGPAELVDDRHLYVLTRPTLPGPPRGLRRIDITSGMVDANWTPVGPAIETATHLVHAGNRLLVVGPAPGTQGSSLRVAFLSLEATSLFVDSFE